MLRDHLAASIVVMYEAVICPISFSSQFILFNFFNLKDNRWLFRSFSYETYLSASKQI